MGSYRLTSRPSARRGQLCARPRGRLCLAGAQRRGQSLPPDRVPALGSPRPSPRDGLFSGRLPGTSSPGAGRPVVMVGPRALVTGSTGSPPGPRPGLDGPGEGQRTREQPSPRPTLPGPLGLRSRAGPLPTGWELSAFNTDRPGRPRGRRGQGGVSDTAWPAPPPPGPLLRALQGGWRGWGSLTLPGIREEPVPPSWVSPQLCPDALSAFLGLWGPL